ncbi:rhodopsin-like [Amphiura filiformis]|uniref:rhodopsin-like n=1 Tax=Amphiura filiformis TaxID=82378 RepID=UPI003B213C93
MDYQTSSSLTVDDDFGSVLSTNESSDPYDINLTTLKFARMCIYYIILLPFAIFGNIIVIYVSCRILKHGKIPNLLTLSLAISDLSGVFLVHVPVIVALVAGHWLGGIYTCVYQYLIAWSFLKLSYFIVVLMTIDRYLALCKPFYYYKNAKSRMMLGLKAVLSLAAFSILGTSVTTIFHSHSIFMSRTWYMCMNSSPDMYYWIIIAFWGSIFAILTGIFIYCNVRVVHSMITGSKGLRGRRQSTSPIVMSSREKREKRFVKVIIGLSIEFLICWIPYVISIFLRHAITSISVIAEDITLRMVLANMAFNPVICIIFNQTYRRGCGYFILLMCHKLTIGLIEKPKDNNIFYLRSTSSYLQHRHARRRKPASPRPDSSAFKQTISNPNVTFRKKMPSSPREKSTQRIASLHAHHWVALDNFGYEAPEYEGDGDCCDKMTNADTSLDGTSQLDNMQMKQCSSYANEHDVDILRCKVTVDINLDVERIGSRAKNFESKTLHIELNLETKEQE